MFWWTVTVRAAVFTTAIRIDAVAKGNVGTVVLTDDALRVVEEELGTDSLQPGKKLGIVLEVGVVWNRVRRSKPIGRFDRGAASMQDGKNTENAFSHRHDPLPERQRR